MIVWGGLNYDYVIDSLAYRYELDADTWSASCPGEGPTWRYDHIQLWIGSGVFIWGGEHGSGAAIYSPCSVPAIGTETIICAGEPITLDAGPGYDSYLWEPDGQTTQEITVAPLTTTTYTVHVTAGGHGASASHRVWVGADVDGNGAIETADLVALVGHLWGGTAVCPDLTGDGETDAADLAAWIVAFTLR